MPATGLRSDRISRGASATAALPIFFFPSPLPANTGGNVRPIPPTGAGTLEVIPPSSSYKLDPTPPAATIQPGPRVQPIQPVRGPVEDEK